MLGVQQNAVTLSVLQVHLRSHFIMNGVCVRWRGWIDLERLDGVGCLEYDEDKAQVRHTTDVTPQERRSKCAQ
jgi:hypothetical protein